MPDHRDYSAEKSPEVAAEIEEGIHQLRTLRLFTWNLWFGGREINQGREKQAAVLNEQNPDIALLQETYGDGGIQVGRGAGMTVAQQDFDTAVATPNPVQVYSTDTAPFATAALVSTRVGDVLAWSVHLDPFDYGPYRRDELPDACDEVFAQIGERTRDEQIRQVLAETDRLQALLHQQRGRQVPVIIAGDFNVPIGTDWLGAGQVLWPATQRLLDSGYVDAFREVYPDPAQAPGLTWSQIEPEGKEPRDRIDFIFLDGFEVVSCDHLGGAADDLDAPADAGFRNFGGRTQHIPNQFDNAFPSDHLAVRAVVRPTK